MEKLTYHGDAAVLIGPAPPPCSGCDGGDRPIYSNIWSKGGLLLDTSLSYNTASSTCPANFVGQAASANNAGLRKNEVTTSTAVNLVDGNQLFLVRSGMRGVPGGGAAVPGAGASRYA